MLLDKEQCGYSINILYINTDSTENRTNSIPILRSPVVYQKRQLLYIYCRQIHAAYHHTDVEDQFEILPEMKIMYS